MRLQKSAPRQLLKDNSLRQGGRSAPGEAAQMSPAGDTN